VRELLRSNEIVFLSWADALLKSEDIEIFVLDGHMSVIEGSAGAILRRVMVADEDYDRARRLLEEAGEGDRLV
jgi:integrase